MMLNLKSLREQVYYHLREEMHQGRLLPGASIDLNQIARSLGISKTPLRDALIQLESEGFVKILPRRGVRVATLTLNDIKNLYEIIGMLEAGIIMACFRQLTGEKVAHLERLNQRMRQAVNERDFDSYYNLNLEFHGVYVELSDNSELRRLMTLMKQRLYDFPRRCYIKEWELNNCDEHERFTERVKQGDALGAARLMRDVHWSYKVQEDFIHRFYSKVTAHIEAELNNREHHEAEHP
ncbi:MAG: GntR family transcriptional regulator [Thermodesulfobacteriota bacterium]